MRKETILLNTIKRISSFVNEISRLSCDVDVISGRYIIDAKSIMGLYSLDLSKPVDIYIDTDNQEDIELFDTIIKRYKFK